MLIRHSVLFLVASICLFLAAPEKARGQTDSVQQGQTGEPSRQCSVLLGRTFAEVTVNAADAIPAGEMLPAHCAITGTESGTEGDKTHELSLLLPDEWRGRYLQQGGGGFDGGISALSANAILALKDGTAVLRNNGGHKDPTGAIFLGNPDVIQRYAHGAIYTGAQFAKAVIEAYYGDPPEYSYYAGCSNGGRGALNAAAKYGDEFDGVIAGAVAFNMPGLVQRWTVTSELQMPANNKLSAVHQVAVNKCDANDNALDGVISNWQACEIDIDNDLSDIDLSESDKRVLANLLQDLQLADGQVVYSAFGNGDLGIWAAYHGDLGLGHMRNVVLNDSEWSPTDYDVDAYQARIQEVLEGIYQFSPTSGQLVEYLENGNKALIWHGSADTLVSHKDAIRLWEDVVMSADSSANDNTVFYVAPGVDHCRGGEGADDFDLIGPLIRWVEFGDKPGTLVASRRDESGELEFTRPLCKYPAYPEYAGNGDVTDAANFNCVSN